MSKENILVLEDESVIRDVMYEILIKEGYTIVTASDGEEGYNRVKKEHFDLIITDIKMPKIGGLEFIKRIREEFSADTPVVVITGHGTIDTAIESMRYGAQGFVLKPFTPKELVEAVGHAIYKSQIIKENIKLKAILPLFEINKKILSELNIDRLIEIITKEASTYIRAERTSLMLMDKEKGTLILKASTDRDIKSGETKKIADEEIADMVAKTMTPLLLNDRTSTTPFMKGWDGIKSALSIPIIERANFIPSHPFIKGVVDVLSFKRRGVIVLATISAISSSAIFLVSPDFISLSVDAFNIRVPFSLSISIRDVLSALMYVDASLVIISISLSIFNSLKIFLFISKRGRIAFSFMFSFIIWDL